MLSNFEKIFYGKNLYFIVDVETTGSIPIKSSMYEFGAVALINKNEFEKIKFEIDLMTTEHNPQALAAMNLTIDTLINRKKTTTPEITMSLFDKWINELLIKHKKDRAIFLSDNLAFDWQWINFYFHYFLNKNPFGFSGRRIGDIYSGLCNNISDHSSWKKLRTTKHDHNSLNDAIGNAEAFIKFLKN